MARILKVGQSRLFRSLRLWSITSWVFTIAAITVLLHLFGRKEVSIRALVDAIPDFILSRLKSPFPAFLGGFNGWVGATVEKQMPLGAILLISAALAFVVFKAWPWGVEYFRQSRATRDRKAITVVKWMRAFSPALFLLVGFLPSVLIVVAAFAVGAVSYLAYNLPFLAKTRMR